MMSRFGCAVLLLCASSSLAATAENSWVSVAAAREQSRPAAPLLPRAAFLAQAAIEAVALAPDGRRLAYIQRFGSDRVVMLQLTDNSAARRVQVHSDAHSLYWSRDGRWLLLESASALFAVPTSTLSAARMIVALNAHRSVLGVDPSSDAAILLLERTRAAAGSAARSRLLRVDTRGTSQSLHEDQHVITGAALNREGKLAFLARIEDEHTTILAVMSQPNTTAKLRRVARCEHLERCTLLPMVTPAGELLLQTDAGGGLYRLQRMMANGFLRTEHADPRGEADLDELVLDPLTAQPLFASYRSTVPTVYALDDAVQSQLQELRRALPDRDLSLQIGSGPQAQWLVEERDSTLQFSRWYLFDSHTRALREVLRLPPVHARAVPAPPPIDPRTLVRQIAFSYAASDHMRLHGFLTIPRGTKLARLPLVAYVHGGPWNHVRPGYSTITQLLANRGYAVFEPDFRGSTGLGHDYLLAARGDFGNGRVQQDIVDGVEYLLASGIGDARRVGITGASFGGYSTLLGVTFRPDMFRIGVAAVAPPDFAVVLQSLVRSAESLELAPHVPFVSTLRMLSMDPANTAAMQRLRDQAPLTNAQRMQRPLLIFAAGADRRVPISSIVEYAARLKHFRKDLSLLIDPQAGHSATDPLQHEAFLYLLEAMLAKHLGGHAAAAPDAALQRYLDRSLRIQGVGFAAR